MYDAQVAIMANNLHFLLLILGLTVAITFTKVLPFLFSSVLKNSELLTEIGRYLPPYIMLLLVIFEIRIPGFVVKPYNIPAVSALLVLIPVHWRWRKLILSLVVSVSTYALVSCFI